jgi:hypothetical protein
MEDEGEAKQNGPPAGMPPPPGPFGALQEGTMMDLNDNPVPFASFYKDVTLITSLKSVHSFTSRLIMRAETCLRGVVAPFWMKHSHVARARLRATGRRIQEQERRGAPPCFNLVKPCPAL